MRLSIVWKCARAAVVEADDGGVYRTRTQWRIIVNDRLWGTTDLVETYLDGLEPNTTYRVRYERDLADGTVESSNAVFVTEPETFTLDVRDFGAAGDGERDDTISLQAAIMACPRGGRVLVPAGEYRVKNLFLTSGLTLELAEGATIAARHDRENLAYLPGTVQGEPGAGYAGGDKLPLGRWEGESFPMFCGILTGLGVNDVTVYGRGVIDGGANDDEDNWWYEAKRMRVATRPRMVFLSDCERVDLVGVTVRNSPSWNIHPVLSRNLRFLNLTIESPKVSPNTDGLNPESCDDVLIKGCHFSVGDDCIAVKSGKIAMPKELRPACRNLVIEQCHMHDGHGSIVLGSEAAGGIKGLIARDCLFERTDRGLRIKTRRGRGRDSVYEAIQFDHIVMDEVKVPFVVNSFYYCDADGTSDYVQNRGPLPVDDGTPNVASLSFRNIEATNCHAAAAYITGLPESKIGRVAFHHVHVTFAPDAQPFLPAMACGVEEMTRQGIIAQNVSCLVLDDVDIEGQEGDAVLPSNIDVVE
ncbi:glycoside hydrolase family 28 protein [Bifidobacterium eulemuris]|uniref:Glycoside hydrolase family 28 protein n=1 Tax=Bifidobacterium eulemuris TaxID=1765219 RepID=A0A261G7T6_9BIFI|nr:glycoside hydrolase family 28 protein [Bifidobacterium eulemuris]OZG67491.1 Glycosyl hydrolases family 28 [Bifidobacterium eulemuris]QOL31033.1 glycoside hydrolase family 28 protein [Bifidobacterium eulemuris]QOL33047.1 glycoside hydrolase family 28 protein [Bifidobacterium eulemuris]